MERGLVQTTSARNPITGAQQPYFTSEDVSAFHARYITLTGLADRVGETWQALRPQLKKLGATKLERDGEDFGSIFAWSEIEAKFACRWPREPRIPLE